MTIVYIVVGLGAGLLLGYMIGLSMLNKNKTAWEEELTDARKQLETIKREGGSAIKQERARASNAEEKLAALGNELNKLRQSAQQADQIQQEFQQIKQAHATAHEAAEAHKNARQQAENRYRQAEATLSQAQKQIVEIGRQLEGLQAEKSTLEATNQRQVKELKKLRADSASARGSSSGLDQSVEAFAETDGSLEGVLNVLLDNEGQNAAVIADNNGIIVAAVGDDQLKEGMAASAQMIATAVRQLEGMVPFNELRAYKLQDDGSNVMAGRFFQCAGENVGLATYGPREPSDRMLDGAMANVSSILE